MKTEERIIKYLENELSPDERIGFETDLRNSSQFREELENYLIVKKEITNQKEINLNQIYLDSIIPEFRNKLGHKKTATIKRNLSYAFGAILAFIFSFLIFQKIFTENKQLNEIQEFAEALNEIQRFELLDKLNGDSEEYYQLSENSLDVELTNLLQTDLRINYDVAEEYDINLTELVDGLSASEAENIYNEILNKNFSEEVKL